jgi:hypothetical protein
MPANDAGSAARDLEDLRAGRDSATKPLVRRYWGRHEGLIRGRVRWYGRPAVSVDEQYVANAALNSVIIRLRRGT